MIRSTVFAALMFATTAIAVAEPHLGAPAPEFSLPSVVDQKPVALKAALVGKKAAVVLFIATKCPFSNGYNDRMAALAKDYAAKGVVVIGINSNKTEPVAEVAAHGKEHKLEFPLVKDDGSKIADAYGAQHTPEAYIVDGKGKLVYHGRIDDRYDDPTQVKASDLRAALDEVVAGKAVTVAETKAFGCSIKR